MIEYGKTDGPPVLVRYKICKAGTTDWVGWIMGARALDCPERGGLGFQPMNHAHSFSGLNIFTERSEYQAGPRPDECYAIALSCVDSDSDDEYEEYGSRPSEPGGAPAAGAADPEQLGCPVLYEGDPITVTKGEGVWIPVVVGPSPLSVIGRRSHGVRFSVQGRSRGGRPRHLGS